MGYGMGVGNGWHENECGCMGMAYRSGGDGEVSLLETTESNVMDYWLVSRAKWVSYFTTVNLFLS